MNSPLQRFHLLLVILTLSGFGLFGGSILPLDREADPPTDLAVTVVATAAPDGAITAPETGT